MRKLIWLASVLLAGAVLYGVVGEVLASRSAAGVMSGINGPYVPLQTITSTLLNNRYNDIETEITDSLSRSGKGPMLAPLKNVDGTKAAPAVTFNSEAASGDYRAGSNDLRKSVNNTDIEKWVATGPTSLLPHTFTGTAAEGAIILTPLAAPSAPSNGAVWVETTSNVLKARINGTTKTVLTSTIARTDLPAVGQQVSSSSSNVAGASTTSATYVDINNLSVTFTSTGRPVMVILQPDAANPALVNITSAGQVGTLGLLRDSTTLGEWTITGQAAANQTLPVLVALDAGASAASHTWKLQFKVTGGSTFSVKFCVLAAYEL